MVFCLCFTEVHAQHSFEDYLKAGDEAYQNGEYPKAYNYYTDALGKAPNHPEALYLRAQVCLSLHKNLRALEDLRHTERTALREPDNYAFWLAYAYFRNEKFNEASHFLDLYLRQSQRPLKKEAEQLESFLTNAQYFYDKKSEYILENLGTEINSSDNDFAPVLDKSQKIILFKSDRLSLFRSYNAEKSNLTASSLFHADMRLDGSWTVADTLPLKSLQKEQKELSLQFIEERLATNARRLRLTPEGNLKIMVKHGRDWEVPEPVIENKRLDISANNQMTSLSEDGKWLVVSAKKGNQFDLYYSRWEGEKGWSKPKPLQTLNSDENEISPFLVQENYVGFGGETVREFALYFSSKGHNSMGGYDVFRSVWNAEAEEWDAPQNLGYPINTVSDEIEYSVSYGVAYLASNRNKGEGGLDIYRAYRFSDLLLGGTILDRYSNEPVGGCVLQITDSKDVLREVQTNAKGQYEVRLDLNERYRINVFYQDKLRYEQYIKLTAFMLAGKKEKRVEQNFYILSNEESATTEARFTKTSPGSVYVLRNIYFETGSVTPSPESDEEIKSFANFLKKYDEVKVAIGGHTDNVGDPEENRKLSQKRAESIRQILIGKHGINAGRITAIGYGDTRPMATNDDEEEGRELNRRIDATILE